jgi:hypothetical protein
MVQPSWATNFPQQNLKFINQLFFFLHGEGRLLTPNHALNRTSWVNKILDFEQSRILLETFKYDCL